MSCHGCATSFSLFNKELSCASCGFSYCKKCLKQKAVVPKHGLSLQKVCKACYKMLQQENVTEDTQDIRALDSLEDPSRPPITVYVHNQRLQRLKRGLSKEDKEIVERLEKLKEERKQSTPTDGEVAMRLAKLKDVDVGNGMRQQTQFFVKPDTRTSVDQAGDLIKQFQEEVDLESQIPRVEDEIEQRLRRLRGIEIPSRSEEKVLNTNVVVNADDSGSLPPLSLEEESEHFEKLAAKTIESAEKGLDELEKDPAVRKCLEEAKKKREESVKGKEEESVKGKEEEENVASSDDEDSDAVIEKIIAEQLLDEKLDFAGSTAEESEEIAKTTDADVLPWCVICNADAVLECPECSGDLYCRRCFDEAHEKLYLENHKPVAYKPH